MKEVHPLLREAIKIRATLGEGALRAWLATLNPADLEVLETVSGEVAGDPDLFARMARIAYEEILKRVLGDAPEVTERGDMNKAGDSVLDEMGIRTSASPGSLDLSRVLAPLGPMRKAPKSGRTDEGRERAAFFPLVGIPPGFPPTSISVIRIDPEEERPPEAMYPVYVHQN